ncbi:hypothetical protein CK223_28920 [Mesorhizobium loti]|uniref:hypothetical protein n=1 Tax=Rhizobium loti TaxID=381 RepID=UPI0008023DD2|nr:hypothetical protein [Mesorhizobium loti]PBB52484.1 hypothetical protein CK223_28920 [Mesorhizobium loti]
MSKHHEWWNRVKGSVPADPGRQKLVGNGRQTYRQSLWFRFSHHRSCLIIWLDTPMMLDSR